MKKMLVSGLVLFLVFFGISFGLISCDTDDKKTDEKVIAEEFRGIWILNKNLVDNKLYRHQLGYYFGIRITDNKIEFIYFNNFDSNNNPNNVQKDNDMTDVTNVWSNDTTKTIYEGDNGIATYGANENILNIYGILGSNVRMSPQGHIYTRLSNNLFPETIVY